MNDVQILYRGHSEAGWEICVVKHMGVSPLYNTTLCDVHSMARLGFELAISDIVQLTKMLDKSNTKSGISSLMTNV